MIVKWERTRNEKGPGLQRGGEAAGACRVVQGGYSGGVRIDKVGGRGGGGKGGGGGNAPGEVSASAAAPAGTPSKPMPDEKRVWS